ncbi:MAG: hypothetical protein KDA70_04705, partial [Planctomycetaceae bacterium]|nr:hypothetical protein [Planctomycetaceae bacterium]
HESERQRQRLLNRQVMGTNKRIPLRNLLSMTEYPSEMQQVLTLYAEGYSLADYLLQTGGKKRYLMFLEDAHKNGWDEAIAKMYKIKNVEALEQRWGSWIMAGSPSLNLPAGQQLAAAEPQQVSAVDNKDLVIRSQSPDQVEADFVAEMPEQTALASAEPAEELQRESRPLPIDSRIPFSGRPAQKRQIKESVAFVPEAKRLPRTSLHQDSVAAPQTRPQPVTRPAQQMRPQQRPAARYNRGASSARGGIDLGQSAEIDF